MFLAQSAPDASVIAVYIVDNDAMEEFGGLAQHSCDLNWVVQRPVLHEWYVSNTPIGYSGIEAAHETVIHNFL
jgi:hypothetical protein